MILKVDGVTTEQFYELTDWLGSSENSVSVDEAKESDYGHGNPITHVTRNRIHYVGNGENLSSVARVISVKGNLTKGKADGDDTYDLVLEVPQAMFFQIPNKKSIMSPIPERIMREIQAILVHDPDSSDVE